MGGLRTASGSSAAAFRAVLRNPNLRSLQLSWTTWIVAHWAYLVAVSVYAYGAGGEEAVGIVLLPRLLPAAVVSPFAGLLADRYRREQVLLVANSTRVALIGTAAAAVALDAPASLVYGLAIVDSLVSTPVRSAQAALTPTLARSPGGADLGERGRAWRREPRGVLGAGARRPGPRRSEHGRRLRRARPARRVRGLRRGHPDRAPRAPPRGARASTIASEALAGFRTVGPRSVATGDDGPLHRPDRRGRALQVFIAVLALESLDLGDGGVGYLNSAHRGSAL